LAAERGDGKRERSVAASDIEHARPLVEPVQDDLRKHGQILVADRKSLIASRAPELARRLAEPNMRVYCARRVHHAPLPSVRSLDGACDEFSGIASGSVRYVSCSMRERGAVLDCGWTGNEVAFHRGT